MSVPSKRRPRSAVRKRASHHALKAKATTKCSNCGASLLPHRACAKCGYYKGKKVR